MKEHMEWNKKRELEEERMLYMIGWMKRKRESESEGDKQSTHG